MSCIYKKVVPGLCKFFNKAPRILMALCLLYLLILPIIGFSQSDDFGSDADVLQGKEIFKRGGMESSSNRGASPSMDGALPEASYTKEGERISLDVKGMDIIDVLKILSDEGGFNVSVSANVSGRVTLFLKDVNVWDALEIVLLSAGLAYEKNGGVISVMAERDYELKYGKKYSDKRKLQIFNLKYANATRMRELLSQLISSIGKVVVDEPTNTVMVIDIAERLPQISEIVANVDRPIETKVFGLNYLPVKNLEKQLSESITKDAGSFKIDEISNKIIVTDYPDKLMEIERLIRGFDEKTPQVLIDAQIVEISPQKDQFSVGIDWDYWLKKNVRLIGSLPASGVTDVATIPNKLSIGVAAADAAVSAPEQSKAVLDLLRVIGETKILSSPRIMALNNQEAKIMVGTKEAYITSATSQTGETAVTSQTVNFVDVGIKLYVTPTINRDGFVTMKIKPEISSSVTTELTSQNQKTQVPIVTTSETETTIMVKDGVTIIIAGLKRDKKINETRKIPVLGDIPFLGYLFKNKKDEVIKTELVIFITPRIISGDEPLDYTSITNDKDILSLQAQAKEAKSASDNKKNISKEAFPVKESNVSPVKERGSFTPLENSFLTGRAASSGDGLTGAPVLSKGKRRLKSAAFSSAAKDKKPIAIKETIAVQETNKQDAVIQKQGENKSGEKSYYEHVVSYIRDMAILFHPNQTGKVKVAFTLGADGKLIGEPRVVSNNASQELGELAKKIIKESSPFLPLPLDKAEETFEILLVF